MSKKIIQTVIRNDNNTDWDEIFPIGVDLSVKAPEPGYTTVMTTQLGQLNSDVSKKVTIITEVFKNENAVAIKTIKTKVVQKVNEMPSQMVEMINLVGYDPYEILTVFSLDANGMTVSNDVVQVYGTWDVSNPVTIL